MKCEFCEEKNFLSRATAKVSTPSKRFSSEKSKPMTQETVVSSRSALKYIKINSHSSIYSPRRRGFLHTNASASDRLQ